MKIGDLVCRSYRDSMPGIVVDETIDIVTANNEETAYEECWLVVQWSDGTQSEELYEELDLYEDVLYSIDVYNKTSIGGPVEIS